jgi:hypothetical protein
MELSHIRKRMPIATMTDPKILVPAVARPSRSSTRASWSGTR